MPICIATIGSKITPRIGQPIRYAVNALKDINHAANITKANTKRRIEEEPNEILFSAKGTASKHDSKKMEKA